MTKPTIETLSADLSKVEGFLADVKPDEQFFVVAIRESRFHSDKMEMCMTGHMNPFNLLKCLEELVTNIAKRMRKGEGFY